MEATGTQHNWRPFVDLFGQTNRSRPTRIAVFEGEPEDWTDDWLEDGLPLTGIDIEERPGKPIALEIMLGTGGTRQFTHAVKDVRSLRITLSATGVNDGLEIGDAEGRTTVLRFDR